MDRGELVIDLVRCRLQPQELMKARPAGKARRVTGAIAVYDGDKSQCRRRADQRQDNPFFKAIEDTVEHQRSPSGEDQAKIPPRAGGIWQLLRLRRDKTRCFVDLGDEVFAEAALHILVNRHQLRDPGLLLGVGQDMDLHLAGGPDRTADQKREFILRADGSVLSRQYTSAREYGGFDRVLMLPGDTVIVPPKIEKDAILRDLVNISSILQGFGIAAAAVEVLK